MNQERLLPLFHRLVQPIGFELFALEYWTKKSLFISRQQDGYYSDVFQWDEFMDFLNDPNLSASGLRVIKVGDTLSKEQFGTTERRGLQVFERADSVRLKEYFDSKYSLMFDMMWYTIPRLSSYIRAIEEEVKMSSV